MAITTICPQINKNSQYPTYTTISAPYSCGTIVLQFSDAYTPQMLWELPNVTINVWTEENGKLVLYTSRALTLQIPKDSLEISTILTDIPISCIFSLQPEFDNRAFLAHNKMVRTMEEGQLWTDPTTLFPVKILFDDTNVIAGGGGGGEIPIDTQVDPDSENPVQNKAIYNFVNSSVATNTAYFVGTFKTLVELEASSPVTNNDYGFVIDVESAILTAEEPSDWSTNWTDYYTYSSGTYYPVSGSTAPTWQPDTYYKADGVVYNRYKYNGETETWMFEYALNNSSYTAVEWATIQSGLTAADKTQLQTNTATITNIPNVYQTKLSQIQLDAVNSGIDSTKVTQIATNTSNISIIQTTIGNINSVLEEVL